MFQPTNESYIRSMVEASFDRHLGESEADRALREEEPYRPHQVLHRVAGLVASFTQLLMGVSGLFGASAPTGRLTHRQTPLD